MKRHIPPTLPAGRGSATRRADLICVLLLVAASVAMYAPALFTGRVLLPADLVTLMPPWSATAQQRFPESRFAHNQLHGPIFEYYSWRFYSRERIRTGEVPLWNPYELGGNVLLANCQSAVLYPPNLLLYVFPLAVGINLTTLLHTALTGIFMFGLLRTLGMGRIAAVTGALTWMFCGVQIVWTEFQTPTAALCWLPAALWGWELGCARKKPMLSVALCGLALAMSLLAGHLQFAFYVLLAAMLYAVWRTVPNRSRPTNLGLGLASVGLAASLAAAALLPTIEMSRMNFRAESAGYAASIAHKLPPANLATLLLPNLFGNPVQYVQFDSSGTPSAGHDYWGSFDFIEFNTYVGVPAVILAVAAVPLLWLSRLKRGDAEPRNRSHFAVWLACTGLLLAVGTPLCALFYYLVPGYKQFNATARALCLFSFAAAWLAAYTVECLASDVPVTSRRAKRIALNTLAIAAAAGLFIFPGMGLVWQRLYSDDWFGYETANTLRMLLFCGGTGVLLCLLSTKVRVAALVTMPVLCVADLVSWGGGFNTVAPTAMLGYATKTGAVLQTAWPARTASIEAPDQLIKSFIAPNINVTLHAREVQGADSLHTARIHRLMERVVKRVRPDASPAFADGNTLHYPGVDDPVLNLLNIKYLTTRNPVDGSRYRLISSDEIPLYENLNPSGPAWIVGAAERIFGLDQAFTALEDPAFHADRTALVEQDVGDLDEIAARGTVRVTQFAPHKEDAEVTANGRALVLFSEIWYPGWRAAVDGIPAPIYQVDYILRAIPVTAGRHHITMRYQPASYLVGVYVSLVACGFLAALAVLTVAKRLVFHHS